MAGIGYHDIVGFGPGAVQFVGAHDRTDDIVAALNDDGRDMADSVDSLEQTVFRGEHIVAEVMRLDPGETRMPRKHAKDGITRMPSAVYKV